MKIVIYLFFNIIVCIGSTKYNFLTNDKNTRFLNLKEKSIKVLLNEKYGNLLINNKNEITQKKQQNEFLKILTQQRIQIQQQENEGKENKEKVRKKIMPEINIESSLKKNQSTEKSKIVSYFNSAPSLSSFSTISSSLNKFSTENWSFNNNNRPIKNMDRKLSRQRREHFYRDGLCREDCRCFKDNAFLTVECDFTGKTAVTINMKRPIPENTTLLKIKLGRNTNLKIEENSFKSRSVNSIVIEGNTNGEENIEICQNAFNGNIGQFPELNITNCHTVTFRENSLTNLMRKRPSEYMIYVTNIKYLMIMKKAFSNTQFHGYFNKIDNLRIHTGAFYGAPKSVINISWAKMESFHPLESALKEVKITNSTINSIKTEAFNVIDLTSVIFQDTKIDIIESKVFTEKLYGTYWEFVRCQIGVIKSNAIDQSGVSTLIFENNRIDEIENQAISVTAVNVSFSYNSVSRLGIEWLTVKEWTNVTIFNNTFGSYNLINIGRSQNPIQCLFEKNSITKPQPGSMNITNYTCKIKETYFYQECNCRTDWIDKLSKLDIKKESFCRISDALKFCLNATVFNVHKYYDEICEETTEKIICEDRQSKVITDEHFISPNEIDTKNNIEKQSWIIYIIIGITAIILIVLLIIYFVLKYWFKKQTITIPMSDMTTQQVQENTTTMMKNSKSFSNDDRLIINETLEKMKKKQSSEKYDQVFNNTKKLLQGNLTESEKVLTIGEIVRTLDDCENTGEDFVAFTDILYKHLAPKNNNQSDPVYAEPNLFQALILPPPPYNHRGDDDPQTILDHIYAEPHSLQQPLLTNEYASPLDRNEMAGIYSEPIASEREKARQIITPYAIAIQHSQSSGESDDKINQQQSTSKNLPDVLDQSLKPLSKVQILAKNFANNPNFHITRSPITNRKIPQYTIPNKPINANNQPLQSSYFENNNKLDSDSSNSHSDHSGGSDITYKLDEIEFADA